MARRALDPWDNPRCTSVGRLHCPPPVDSANPHSVTRCSYYLPGYVVYLPCSLQQGCLCKYCYRGPEYSTRFREPRHGKSVLKGIVPLLAGWLLSMPSRALLLAADETTKFVSLLVLHVPLLTSSDMYSKAPCSSFNRCVDLSRLA